MDGFRYYAKLEDEIRAHQAAALRPEREVVGAIVLGGLDGRLGYRYQPLRNRARGDGRFMVRHEDIVGTTQDGMGVVLVHSHPWYGPDEPSRADLKGAHRTWLNVPYGIYHPHCGLNWFLIHEDRKGYTLIKPEVI